MSAPAKKAKAKGKDAGPIPPTLQDYAEVLKGEKITVSREVEGERLARGSGLNMEGQG